MAERLIQTPIMHRAVVHGGLVFLGGATCDDESLDMGGQVRQILRKLDGYLAEAGSDKTRLLAATLYVTDLGLKPQLDAAWKEWLAPGDFPARATVGVADLGGGTLVEISVIAHT